LRKLQTQLLSIVEKLIVYFMLMMLSLSTSQDGLQCKLNKLQAFCDDWGIDVNLSKTTAMIFIKTGKHLRERPFNLKGRGVMVFF
jgi:hypothetical protein